MDTAAKWVLGIYGIIILVSIVVIVILIIRRVKIRKSEDFEKRDN